MTSEHLEQQAVFEWASLMSGKHPELELLHANPNQATYNRAAKYRAEGMKVGIPDIFLPCIKSFQTILSYDTNYYHGLFIEMKVGKNKPTPEQLWWIERLTRQGYRVAVCYSADEAIAVIKDYLGITEE